MLPLLAGEDICVKWPLITHYRSILVVQHKSSAEALMRFFLLPTQYYQQQPCATADAAMRQALISGLSLLYRWAEEARWIKLPLNCKQASPGECFIISAYSHLDLGSRNANASPIWHTKYVWHLGEWWWHSGIDPKLPLYHNNNNNKVSFHTPQSPCGLIQTIQHYNGLISLIHYKNH